MRDTWPPAGFTVSDLIFSEPGFTVEHEWGLLDSLQPCSAKECSQFKEMKPTILTANNLDCLTRGGMTLSSRKLVH